MCPKQKQEKPGREWCLYHGTAPEVFTDPGIRYSFQAVSYSKEQDPYLDNPVRRLGLQQL